MQLQFTLLVLINGIAQINTSTSFHVTIKLTSENFIVTCTCMNACLLLGTRLFSGRESTL